MNTKNVLLFVLGISIQTILCANNWDVSVGAGNLKQFQPSVFTIEKGDTVTWNWISGEHVVTSDRTEGETVFSANITQRLPTASYTFNELGKHPYYCANYGAAGGWGQSGRINVVLPPPVVSGEATTEEPHVELTSGDLTTGFDATTASEPLTTGHEDLTTQDITTEGVTTQDITTQDITTEGVTTQDITTESITTHDITSEDISTGTTTAEEISTGITTAEEISTGITTEDEEISTGITTAEEITTGITTEFEEITSSDITTGTSGDDGSITTGEDITTDGITTQEVTTQEVTTQEVTTQEVTTQEVTTQEVTTEEVTTEEVTTEEVTTQEITTEEITTGEDDITTEDITTGEDDLTTGFFTTEDITTGEDDLTTGIFSASTTGGDITSEDITTQDITSESLTTGTFTCNVECKNGGSCVGQDQCGCVGGYFGETCASFVCDSPCQNGGNCSAPNTCDCRTYQTGYSGSTCNIFNCDDNNDCTIDSISGGTCLHSVISSATCTGSHPVQNDPITVIIQNSAGLNEATLTVSSGALRDRDGSGREITVDTVLRSQNSLPSTIQSVSYHTSGLMVTTPAYTEVIGSVSVCFYVDLTGQGQPCLGYNANSDNTWTCQSHLSRKRTNYYCGTTNRLNSGFFAVITIA